MLYNFSKWFIVGMVSGLLLVQTSIAQNAIFMLASRDYKSYTVTITRVDTTATAVTSTRNEFVTGDVVLIAGANQTEYNGAQTVTVTNNTTFTYTVSGSPVTPATGTITGINNNP